MLRKVAFVFVGLVVLAGVVWFGGRAYLSRSVPVRQGTLPAAGLSAPVDVVFDARGIPQIWSETNADAWYTLGWLHASDRLFQMELVRRLSRGELAEVFGEKAFETDRFQRTVGFGRRAARDATSLTAQAEIALESYVAGVNAYIAQAKQLPPEFVVLRFKPRPWTIEDCLAVTMYQTWFSHQLMDGDERYQKLVAKIGPAAAALIPVGHPWSPPTVPDEFATSILGATGMRATAASNSWVVAPSKSTSGAALHASDPHLSIDQVPGLWYLAGLHSREGLDIVGVTYGGGPFVVMGHNNDIAFAFTVASIDLIDYYDDDVKAAKVVARELVKVKGEDRPRVVEVREGARGVFLDDKTSMHWAGFDFSTAAVADAGLRLQLSHNFVDFRNAVTGFGALDANWVYSDRRGNIGYQLGAPVPLRDFDSFRRQKASDPQSVWKGYRPLSETPHAFNPSQGFLASSNNNVVSPAWPYPLPGFFDPYRQPRIVSLLGSSPKLGADDMRRFQLDLRSGIAERWKALAASAAKGAGTPDVSTRLTAWDGAMAASSREAAVFAFWWQQLTPEIFQDELGDEWKAGGVLKEEALSESSPVLDDRRTPQVETRDAIAARAMKKAIALANGRTWGEASRLSVNHPLGVVKPLDWFLRLNRGGYSVAGDAGSINANFTDYDADGKSFRPRVGPSMRFVLDWANVDGFTLTGALGQSGNPFDPHYADFLPMMQRGEAWVVPFSRDAVYARRASVLTLKPEEVKRQK